MSESDSVQILRRQCCLQVTNDKWQHLCKWRVMSSEDKNSTYKRFHSAAHSIGLLYWPLDWICTGSTPNLQTGTPVVAAINFRPKRRAASPKLAAAYKQGFNGWIQFQSELGALRLKSVGNIYARDENTPSSSPTQSTHYGPLTNTKPSWYADPWQRKALKKNLWSFHIKGKGESNTFRL